MASYMRVMVKVAPRDVHEQFTAVVNELGLLVDEIVGTCEVGWRAGSGWIEVLLSEFGIAPDIALELSFVAEETLALEEQSTVGSLSYAHFVDGKQVRRLEHLSAEEPPWQIIEGDPQAWEAALFEDDDEFLDQLQDADDETAGRLHKARAERQISVELNYPQLDFVAMARALGLPGFPGQPQGELTLSKSVC